MAISDSQFRLGVAIGATLLVAGIASIRFCGSVSLPPKPVPAGGATSGTSSELLASSAGTANVYRELLAKDAIAAGVRTPSIEDMSRKFAYRADDARHVLEVGQPAIELAGLKLRALHTGDQLVLEIVNATDAPLAYHVVAEPTPAGGCTSARPLPIDLATIDSDPIVRTECVWHDGGALVVKKVETLAVPPLGIYLLRQAPPALLLIDANTARGARVPASKECTSNLGPTVRLGVERGEIGWRDLADYYARHRCQTYQFPPDYRAFTQDGQRALPVTRSGN